MLGKLNKYQQRCADNLRAWEAYRNLQLGDVLRYDKDRIWLLSHPSLGRGLDSILWVAAPNDVKVLEYMKYNGFGKTAHGSTAHGTFRETVPFASVQLTFHKITPGLNDEDFYTKIPEAKGALSVLEWDVDAGNPSYGDLASLGLHALEVLKNHLLRRKTNPFNIEKLFRARGIL